MWYEERILDSNNELETIADNTLKEVDVVQSEIEVELSEEDIY